MTRLRKNVIGTLAVVLTAAAGWHVFASMLWIYPPSPLREVVPKDALHDYMIPMFGQSWSVFAPEPINGDYHFNVRAQVDLDGDGAVETTGWVSATDVEISMTHYTLFPPRAGGGAASVASSYKSAYEGLEQPQQAVATGAEDTLSLDDLTAALGAIASDAGSEKYLDAERLSLAYATQVAKAMWGDDVEAVQFRVSRQNVIPFADRHDPSAERPDPTVILPGWRTPYVVDGQDEAAFADVFAAQFERHAESR